jgi:hypothetical protein
LGRGKSAKNLALIAAARTFLVEAQPTTVRGICYHLFTRGLLESMAKKCTDRVSTQLTWAREHEEVPWEWIVDETRAPEYVNSWNNPEQLLQATIDQYRKNAWADQPRQVEVWSEKGTVRGILAPVLNEYGVTFRVMHGYGSATAVHNAAQESRTHKRPLLVFYVGDWDPSGMGMSEADLPTRLERYTGNVALRRVALSHADVLDPALPGFPAVDKHKDPRYPWFVATYGTRCWEVDAINPNTLRARVESSIRAVIDWPAWHRSQLAEQAEVQSLREIVPLWKRACG